MQAGGFAPSYAAMIGKLNHVGVATPSIEESLKLYRDVLGATDITEKRALPEQGVWVSFVNLPNAQIELIEPYGEDSPIHGFLAKNPRGGQHHVCFEVPRHPRRARRDAGQGRDGAGDGRAAHRRPRRAGDFRSPEGHGRRIGRADGRAHGAH